jgi:hypothetical protein
MLPMSAMLVGSKSMAVGWLFNTTAWQSLIGHMIYGLLRGAIFALIQPRVSRVSS